MASPPEPTYFLDENMESVDLATLLSEAGLQCVRISAAPHPLCRGMKDHEWIPTVAKLKWWGLTCDKATLKMREEIAAVRHSGAVHIILRAADLNLQQMAAAIIKAHPTLRAKVWKLTRPAIVYVSRDGKVQIVEGERRGGVKRD